MVYRLLGLVIALVAIIFFIAMVSPLVAGMIVATIMLFIVVLAASAALWGVIEVQAMASQRQFYMRVLNIALRIREYVKSGLLPFVYGGLIVLTPLFALFAVSLPYFISMLVMFQVIGASYRHIERLPAGEVANSSGALAVVVAIFAISLTMLPAYIRLSMRLFRWIRVAQGGYLEGRFMFGSEELSYEAAAHRLFAQDQEVKSRGAARNVLDNLRAGVLDGYKYNRWGRSTFVEFSRRVDKRIPHEVCRRAYFLMYRSNELNKSPGSRINWRYSIAALNWLGGVKGGVIMYQAARQPD